MRQQSHDFHVVGLGEHVDQRESLGRISFLRKEAEVPRESCGFARGVDDPFRIQRGNVIDDRLAACPGRVEDDQIGMFSCPAF